SVPLGNYGGKGFLAVAVVNVAVAANVSYEPFAERAAASRGAIASPGTGAQAGSASFDGFPIPRGASTAPVAADDVRGCDAGLGYVTRPRDTGCVENR
ncbi:MAG: hypothetical protein OXB98_23150, partial [Bryobacterales bacterium]|nr:hypothetical protein [Bryobacterales bacterium]